MTAFDELALQVAMLQERSITLADLPLAALRRALFEGTQPIDARTVLQQGSVQSESLLPSSVFPLVTALPTNPRDGEVCFYRASDSAGVVWMLRYRPASTSAYDWEFVGGPRLVSEDTASGTRALTTYGDLTGPGAGPAVTTPLAGDYDVAIGVNTFNSGAGNINRISYDIGGTAAIDADCIRHDEAVAGGVAEEVNRERRKLAIAASTALTMKYKASAGTGTFLNRRITIQPVRVG